MSAPGNQGHYALERSAREYARLALQAELLAPMTRRAFEDAGIGPGMRVLDVGSGAGDVGLLLARMVGPQGAVIGVDSDFAVCRVAAERAEAAGVENLTFMHSDLASYAPETPFDAITGRLVLLYQPDPAAALAGLVRHLRPGGSVVFLEPWMMPGMGPDAHLKRIVTCIFETLRRSGAHVDLGPRLHKIFTGAGLPQPEMRFEVVMDGRDDSPLYRYATETLASLLPKAIEFGLASPGDFDLKRLPELLREERRATGYAMQSLAVVAAWCRKS